MVVQLYEYTTDLCNFKGFIVWYISQKKGGVGGSERSSNIPKIMKLVVQSANWDLKPGLPSSKACACPLDHAAFSPLRPYESLAS